MKLREFGIVLLLMGGACAVSAAPRTLGFLPRNDASSGMMAVEIGNGEFLVFSEKDGSQAPPLEGANVTFYFAAPKFEWNQRQWLYVHTFREDRDQCELYRNSFSESGTTYPGKIRFVPKTLFERYHSYSWVSEIERPANYSALLDWQDPGFTLIPGWRFDMDAFFLVRQRCRPPYAVGTERLLALKARRDAVSWVPVVSVAPESGVPLKIQVVFSGDISMGRGTKVYNFELTRAGP